MEVGQFVLVLFTFYCFSITALVENKTYLLVKHQDNGGKYYKLSKDNFLICKKDAYESFVSIFLASVSLIKRHTFNIGTSRDPIEKLRQLSCKHCSQGKFWKSRPEKTFGVKTLWYDYLI